jgi:exopolyphosphatase/guanosine-5'-triphosphate,3'-diphosphate pyrophosphatase
LLRTNAIQPGRTGRVGVIDIGSNSVRLVVYDGVGRTLIPVFNEKVMSGLARGIASSGVVSPEGTEQALRNLERFRRILDGMEISQVDALATSAVRDAADGPAFVAEIERRTGLTVTTISGVEEGRLSALGVLAGIPGADGVMGDLGGGSLELVAIDRGRLREQDTLPLGPLRLMERRGAKEDDARDVVAAAVRTQSWLPDYAGRTFYAVGGAWRAIAKLHMERTNHPLHIIHHYALPTSQLLDLLGLLSRQHKSSLQGTAGVSRRRLDTLPSAAMVLEGVLRALAPKQVVFSAYGLREGHLFDLLSPEEQAQDPLLHAAALIAHRQDRFGHAEAIAEWTRPLFQGETPAAARLRQAASLLSDIGWLEHPDYRADHAFLRVLRMPYAGVDHHERVFLALAIHGRYGGDPAAAAVTGLLDLLDDAARERAVLLGTTLRLAHTLTGGASTLLERTSLTLSDDKVVLTLPADEASLVGDAVYRRLDGVARATGRKAAIEIARANAAG